MALLKKYKHKLIIIQKRLVMNMFNVHKKCLITIFPQPIVQVANKVLHWIQLKENVFNANIIDNKITHAGNFLNLAIQRLSMILIIFNILLITQQKPFKKKLRITKTKLGFHINSVNLKLHSFHHKLDNVLPVSKDNILI